MALEEEVVEMGAFGWLALDEWLSLLPRDQKNITGPRLIEISFQECLVPGDDDGDDGVLFQNCLFFYSLVIQSDSNCFLYQFLGCIFEVIYSYLLADFSFHRIWAADFDDDCIAVLGCSDSFGFVENSSLVDHIHIQLRCTLAEHTKLVVAVAGNITNILALLPTNGVCWCVQISFLDKGLKWIGFLERYKWVKSRDHWGVSWGSCKGPWLPLYKRNKGSRWRVIRGVVSVAWLNLELGSFWFDSIVCFWASTSTKK